MLGICTLELRQELCVRCLEFVLVERNCVSWNLHIRREELCVRCLEFAHQKRGIVCKMLSYHRILILRRVSKMLGMHTLKFKNRLMCKMLGIHALLLKEMNCV